MALDRARQRRRQHTLRRRLRLWARRVAQLETLLAQAVVLVPDKQAEFAAVGQAEGVSLAELHTLLDGLLPGQAPRIATLGRWTQAAGARAAALRAVRDDETNPRVRQTVIDALYVQHPVLLAVEPERLCWLTGRRIETRSGQAWAEERGRLPLGSRWCVMRAVAWAKQSPR